MKSYTVYLAAKIDDEAYVTAKNVDEAIDEALNVMQNSYPGVGKYMWDVYDVQESADGIRE